MQHPSSAALPAAATVAVESGSLTGDGLLPTSEFLTRLPGVRPRAALRELRNTWLEAVAQDRDTIQFGAVSVRTQDAAACFLHNSKDVGCVSPDGAALLLQLYRAGELPVDRKLVAEVPPELTEYALGRGPLLEDRRAAHEAKLASAAAWDAKVAKPHTVNEAEFSFSLLNEIFIAHRPLGAGSMVIGGVHVEKVITPYTSNSGKSRDYEILFRWTSADGTPKQITRDSVYASNRRNDEERNWGLPK